jgi:hypothetical protein
LEAQECSSRWAPYGSGSTEGPLGQGEPPDVSSTPQPCRAPPPAAGATTTPRHHGAMKTRMTPTCCSSQPRRWRHRHSTKAQVTDLRRRNAQLSSLASLVAVVVAITLGDLVFLMLRLTRSAPLLRRRLILVEDRLLRERRLGRNKVGTFQLEQQERNKVKSDKIFPMAKGKSNLPRRQTTNIFLRSHIGEHREHSRWRPRVGRSPDRLRHATLNLERLRRLRRGHRPSPWGPVGGHVAEPKLPPPERPNTSGMVLPDHLRQGDPDIPKTPRHGPVGLEHLLLLSLGGAVRPFFLRLRDGAAGVRRKRVLGVVLQVEPPPVPAAVRAG